MSMRNTLLLADDMGSNRSFLRKIFENEYDLLEAKDGEQALRMVAENQDKLAAVLLDIVMPVKDGYQVLAEMREQGYLADIPVIVVTSDCSPKHEARALELGALDLIGKPYNPYIIRRRVKNLVDLKRTRRMLTQQVGKMEQTMNITNESIVNTLATITEFRSMESGQHILRIRRFTRILLEEVARSFPEYELDEKKISTISSAAVLHDIGKISIPDSILNKPGKLTKEEFDVMKTHTTAGCGILEEMTHVADREYMRYAYNICRYHHERWDGKGYPDGLKGNSIPICAQVVSIADVYDALTTKRVYKGAVGHEESVNMILNGECGVFNPRLLECLKRVLDQFSECASSFADGEALKAQDIHIPLPQPKGITSEINAQQMSTVKYHTLLSYVGGIVIEVDVNSGAYHLVYDSNKTMRAVRRGDSFDHVSEEMITRFVHPEEKNDAWRCYSYLKKGFFDEGLRRYAQRFRVRTEDAQDYFWMECTLLRLDTGDPNQHRAIVIWQKIRGNASSRIEAVDTKKWAEHTLVDMVGCILRCKNDRWQSVLDGSRQFAEFLGYTEEEFRSNFGGRLMETILPDDREIVLAHAYKQMDYSTTVEIEYRLLGKGGRIIWVRDRTRVLYSSEGFEYTCHAIMDSTSEHEAVNELRSLKERQQILFYQLDEIVFEWDLVKDRITFSSNFKKQFGYEPNSATLAQKIQDGTSAIHQDDLEMLQEQIRAIRSRHDYPSFLGADFRIRKADGTYSWRRMRANCQQTENGKTVCIVGTLSEIKVDKHVLETLQNQSDLDMLTKLYNEIAARERIETYLKERRSGECAALMVIDIDHFHEVNTSYGRMAGDVVLLQCADLLRELFSRNAVAARIGGDDFMVLVKNAPSPAVLKSQCRHFIDMFSQEIAAKVPECRITSRVGVALVPEDGNTFEELFQRAEQALFCAQGVGNGGYAFYQRGIEPAEIQPVVNRRIESDELPGMAGQSLIHYAFKQLYQSDNVEAAIDSILEMIGHQMGVSRIYIFENSRDNCFCDNTFEWCSEGVEPQKEFLQNVSYTDDIPGWQNHYDNQGLFLCTDISVLPAKHREILEPQGIKSMLQCAIMDGGVFRGFVGIDECRVERTWTSEQVEMLSLIAELVSVFLLKKRVQDIGDQWLHSLIGMLENASKWIYIIDPESCEILFSNKRVQNAVSQAKPGVPCYKALMNRDERCEGCVALGADGTKRNCAEIINSYMGLRMKAEASATVWNGRDAVVVECDAIPMEGSGTDIE